MTMVGGTISTLSMPFLWPWLSQAYPSSPDWMPFVSAALSLVGVACAFGVWRWQSWGVVGYLVLQVISMTLNILFSGMPAVTFLVSTAVGVGIFLALVYPRLEAFQMGGQRQEDEHHVDVSFTPPSNRKRERGGMYDFGDNESERPPDDEQSD